jgi:hypothetical protein
VPEAAYAWLGLRVVEVVPSPKFQLQEATSPFGSVLVSVKPQVSALHEEVKEAEGGSAGPLLPTANTRSSRPSSLPVTYRKDRSPVGGRGREQRGRRGPLKGSP